MRLRCIVVGVDGSANAARALEWAITLAEPAGARIVAVHALGLLDRLASEPVPTATHRDTIVDTFATEWCAPLAAAAVTSECVAADGSPADVILATASDVDADLVVVGERGAGPRSDRVLGSTSRRVLGEAGRPVLVVPESGDD